MNKEELQLKRKMHKRIIVMLIGILILAAMIPLWASKFVLRLRSYELEVDWAGSGVTCDHEKTGISDSDCLFCNEDVRIRILQLTDLHNSTFGKENQRLIKMIQVQNPDLIFMTGDMVNQDEESTDIVVDLVRRLSEIAPVYYSYGNHEDVHAQSWGTDFPRIIAAAGAVVLERSYVDTEVKGLPVRIGGIYGYCLPDMESGEDFEEETLFLQEFQNTDRYKMLLCHMPVCWISNGSLDYWDIDLVFAGHAHGGQVVIPFLGGLYAPDQGLLPGKLQGVFDSEDGNGHLILSSGLGSEGIVPRWNNLPEVLQVDLCAQVLSQ